MNRLTIEIPLSMLLLAGCARAPATASLSPTSTKFNCTAAGTIQLLDIDSFGEAGLYFPPCYPGEPGEKYPVLYLLPGFGGTHMEWIDNGIAALTDGMVLSGEISPFLIVTTNNTYDYVRPNDIINILIPYIEANYPVAADRQHRAIAGGSLGGSTASLLTFQHPDLFGSAGIFGNGLVTGMDAQVDAWLEAIPEKMKPRIFLNSGEQDTFMLQQARLLIPHLDKYGIEHAEIFTEGGHSTSYWLSNFPAYYRWLMEAWAE